MQAAARRRGLLLCGAALLWLAPLGARAAVGFESPPTLKATDLAPPGVALRGETYRVDPEVPTDGLLATWTIRSDYGTLVARGPGMLRQRIDEVAALAQLNEMKSSDVFVDSLKASAGALGGAVVNAATNPVATVKAIPAGVDRFLHRAVRASKTAAQKLGDVAENKEAGAPREAEDGQGLNGVAGTEPDGTTTQNLALATGVAAGRATRDILGYDEKRRELAKELKVDPYTTNPILRTELDDVAWSAFAGGLGVKLLAAAVPGGRLVQSTATVTDWVYEKPPGDLRVWIEQELRELGVDQPTIDLFLRHKDWTLTEQMMLVMALETLDGVDGRVAVIETAVTCENEDQARFLALGLHMLAAEHARAPLAGIVEGKPIAMTRSGRAVATMPLDYVSWTGRVAEFADRDELKPHRPMLKLAGRLSPRAAEGFRALGWETHEKVPVVTVAAGE